MADESQRTGGMFMPYPLMGLVLSLVLSLGAGIAGLFIQVNGLQTTILLRDADYQRQQKEAMEKIEQLQVYINNDRERLIRLEEQTKKGHNN